MQATQQLESHEVFQLLRPEQVSILSSASEEVAFKAGETIFRRGEPADDFFVVLELSLPPADSEAAKKLYQQMKEKLGFDPRANLGVS